MLDLGTSELAVFLRNLIFGVLEPGHEALFSGGGGRIALLNRTGMFIDDLVGPGRGLG